MNARFSILTSASAAGATGGWSTVGAEKPARARRFGVPGGVGTSPALSSPDGFGKGFGLAGTPTAWLGLSEAL